MAICVPCQPQSLIALRLLTFVANHIGGQDQTKITSNHLILLENVKNATTLGSPWWSKQLYRKHTADLELEQTDWYQCTGLNQFVFHPSPVVAPANDVALAILQEFYKFCSDADVSTFWAIKRCNPEASKTALELLNGAIYGVTTGLLFDRLEEEAGNARVS